jgi:DHA1 family inner membrane transport protein
MQPSRSPHIALAVSLILTVIGASTYNILPLLTSGAANTLGFSDRQVGIMSLSISVGSGLSAILAGIWVRRVQWPRAALFALGGMLAANLLTMVVHRFWVFVLAQGLAGFFAGLVFSLAMTILSDREESARTFGIAIAVQGVYQVTALLAGPTLLRLAGLNGVIAMVAVPSGLALFFTSLLPAHGRVSVALVHSKGLFTPATTVALIGFGTFFVNAGAYWTYVELIGQSQGMSPRIVANCVAGGVVAGICGGALAGAFGDRFGRFLPLVLAAVLTVGSAFLINGSFGVAVFLTSALLYFFSWNYSLAYQFAIVNAVDSTGRAVAITSAFGYLGSAAGAGLAALFVSPANFRAVTWVVGLAVCVSTVLFACSSAIHRHAVVRGPAADALS